MKLTRIILSIMSMYSTKGECCYSLWNSFYHFQCELAVLLHEIKGIIKYKNKAFHCHWKP